MVGRGVKSRIKLDRNEQTDAHGQEVSDQCNNPFVGEQGPALIWRQEGVDWVRRSQLRSPHLLPGFRPPLAELFRDGPDDHVV